MLSGICKKLLMRSSFSARLVHKNKAQFATMMLVVALAILLNERFAAALASFFIMVSKVPSVNQFALDIGLDLGAITEIRVLCQML